MGLLDEYQKAKLYASGLPRILETNGAPTGLLSYADEAAQKGKPKKR